MSRRATGSKRNPPSTVRAAATDGSKGYWASASEERNPKSWTAGDALDDDEAQRVLDILTTDATQAYEHYEEMLNLDAEGIVRDPSRQGLARELARMNLSLNYYTQWYWKIDLLNLLHFVWLRSDDHAQYEIRAYAEVILKVIRDWVPLTYDAFMDYRVNAASISGPALAVLRRKLSGEEVDQESSGLSGAEWRELMKLLERPA